MRDFVANNRQFAVLILVWLVSGAFLAQSAFIVIPGSVILMARREAYQEIFFGFIFLLILSDSLDPSLKFAKSVKNAYILLFALLAYLEQRKGLETPGISNRFVPFFLIAIFCLAYSPGINTAAQKTLSYILMFYSVPIFVKRLYNEHGDVFLKNLIYFLVVLVVCCLLLRFYSYNMAVSHGSRLRGLFGNPNGLGIFLILVFSAFFILTNLKPHLISRNEKLLFYLVILLCTFLTYSRTAMVSVFMLMVVSRIFQLSAFLGVLFFVTVAIFYSYVMDGFLYVVSALNLNEDLRVESIQEGSGRFIAWKFAWDNIQTSMFVGRGFSYDETLMRANFDYLSRLGHEGGVHNTYLIIWLNTGLIGLVLFLRGFFLSFFKASKQTKLAFPFMFVIMFSINFEPWLAASLNPFTILFLTILTIISDEEIIKEQVAA